MTMASHSDLSDLEQTSNSLIINERDRFDSTDTCACPTTAELSKAVSLSLGFDPLSSPLNMNQSCSGAFAHCEPTSGNSSRGVPEFGAAESTPSQSKRLLPVDPREDFGEVCHGIQQVSCMDLLRSGDMDSAHTLTRGSAISTYVCKESNLFVNPGTELPATSQVDQLLPLNPHYAFSVNQNLYRDIPGAWCANERAYSDRSEPDRGGSGGLNLPCKYCNCAQAALGSRHECRCIWYNKGEQGGKGGMQGAIPQGYGQVESYQSAIPQASYSTIKTEPSVWMDCTDRSLR